jgi:hypothetical protein
MPRFWISCSALLCLALGAVACGSAGGGGGGGAAPATGGVAGTKCTATVQHEGCLNTLPPKRMNCDPSSGVWLELANCAAGEYCAETADPAAPGTAAHLAVCKANTVVTGPDALGDAGAKADATADDSGAQDAKTADGEAPDVVVSDVTTGDVAIPDTKLDTNGCQPQCEGLTCGPDGCGGQCGTCSGVPCVQGNCQTECTPKCADKACGPNGCGGQCGTCPGSAPNCVAGQCAAGCKPQCVGKSCGPDGCGGQCGTCASGKSCSAGQCISSGATLPLGASCFNTSKACGSNAKCMATADVSDWTCQASKQAGQPCGPGKGDCVDGAVCKFTDATKNAMKCYANVAIGAACGQFGMAACTAGATCAFTSSSGATAKCYADGMLDEPCGGLAQGQCQSGLTCMPASADIPDAVCTANGQAGDACGYGIGGCADDASCVWDSAAKNGASCQPNGQIGDTCGDYASPTDCAPWAVCTPASGKADAASTCAVTHLANEECGYGIGFCTAFLGCSYTDSTKTTALCYLAKGKDAACGAGTGVCLPGYSCTLAAAGDTEGTCQDACELDNSYNNGTCDDCVKVDPDCL